MKRLSANTRTIIHTKYALITEDSYVPSTIPYWENATVRVLISPEMGANFTQYLININPTTRISSKTLKAQLFFYLIEGQCTVTVGEIKQKLIQGAYVYIPIGQTYQITGKDAKLVAFQKEYEFLENNDLPKLIFGNANKVKKECYFNDPQLQMQYLLPDDLSMDFAINIFTYQPGGNLPFVESHIMEHGLLYLQGEGIYRLGEDWYHVCKGDVIWMAPYCPQWFTAIGKENAIYIYYKNVNRNIML